MTEFKFIHEPVLSAGRVVFRVHNVGQLDHELVIVKLPDDYPPLDVQLRSDTRRAVPTFFFEPGRRPAQSGTFALDLVRGRYGMLCSVHDPQDPEALTHALKGMNSEFVVP
jgi:hypothetical protein